MEQRRTSAKAVKKDGDGKIKNTCRKKSFRKGSAAGSGRQENSHPGHCGGAARKNESQE